MRVGAVEAGFPNVGIFGAFVLGVAVVFFWEGGVLVLERLAKIVGVVEGGWFFVVIERGSPAFAHVAGGALRQEEQNDAAKKSCKSSRP